MAFHIRSSLVFLVLLCCASSSYGALNARKFGPVGLETMESGSSGRIKFQKKSEFARSLLEASEESNPGDWKPKEEWKSEQKKGGWKAQEKNEEWKPQVKVEEKDEDQKPQEEWKPEVKVEEKKEEWKPEVKVEEKKEEWKPEVKVEEKKEEWKPEAKVEEKTEEWKPELKVEEKKEEWKPEAKVEEKTEEWKPELKIEEKKEEWKPEVKVEEKMEEWKPEVKVEEKTKEWKPELKVEEKQVWKPQEKNEVVKVEEWKSEEKHEVVKVETKEEWKPEEKEEWKHDITQEAWGDGSEELKVEQKLETKPEEGIGEQKLQETRPERQEKPEVQSEKEDSKSEGKSEFTSHESNPQEQPQANPIENTVEVEQEVKNEKKPTVEVQSQNMHLNINDEMPIEHDISLADSEKYLGRHHQVLTRLSEHQEQLQQHDWELRDRENRERLEQHMQVLAGTGHHQEYNPLEVDEEHLQLHGEYEESGNQDDWTAWERNEASKPENKRMEWSHREHHDYTSEDAENIDREGHILEHNEELDVSHLDTEHEIENAGELDKFDLQDTQDELIGMEENKQDINEEIGTNFPIRKSEVEDGSFAQPKQTYISSPAAESGMLRGTVPSTVQSSEALPSSNQANHAASGDVAEHLAKKINVFSDQSKTHFVRVNQDLTNTIVPFLGNKHAPVVASVISYCLLLLPLAVVFFVCEQVREFLTLQKVILFANIYLAIYSELLLVAALGLGSEPMEIFHKFSPASYLVLQLLQAFGYVLYLTLQTADLTLAYADGTAIAKSSATVQMVVASIIGIHYYLTVFLKATQGVPPATSWKAYAFYSIAFMMLCLFARIKRGKKQYLPIGNETTDKKN